MDNAALSTPLTSPERLDLPRRLLLLSVTAAVAADEIPAALPNTIVAAHSGLPAPPADGACARQPGASPAVAISEVNVGVSVTGYGQEGPYRTVVAGTCDGTLFGGDLVLASTAGYWTASSQGGKARLSHFTTGAADSTSTTSAATDHPHLVNYGSGSAAYPAAGSNGTSIKIARVLPPSN